MLTYVYGARVAGRAVDRHGQATKAEAANKREVDGRSEPNFHKFGMLGLCVQDTAGWSSPDRSGLTGSAKSGCN